MAGRTVPRRWAARELIRVDENRPRKEFQRHPIVGGFFSGLLYALDFPGGLDFVGNERIAVVGLEFENEVRQCRQVATWVQSRT